MFLYVHGKITLYEKCILNISSWNINENQEQPNITGFPLVILETWIFWYNLIFKSQEKYGPQVAIFIIVFDYERYLIESM